MVMVLIEIITTPKGLKKFFNKNFSVELIHSNMSWWDRIID